LKTTGLLPRRSPLERHRPRPRPRPRPVLPVLLAGILSACAGVEDPASAPGAAASDRDRITATLALIPKYANKQLCDHPAQPGAAHCHARVRLGPEGAHKPTASPQGLTPSDLHSAYAIPASGAAATIAIVDAQDDPQAEADLATYRSTFNLPACTT